MVLIEQQLINMTILIIEQKIEQVLKKAEIHMEALLIFNLPKNHAINIHNNKFYISVLIVKSNVFVQNVLSMVLI